MPLKGYPDLGIVNSEVHYILIYLPVRGQIKEATREILQLSQCDNYNISCPETLQITGLMYSTLVNHLI